MSDDFNHELEVADSLRNEGQWQKAITIYEKIVKSFPQTPSLHHNLAVCYFALGQHRDSLSFAKAAVHLDPHLWQSEIILAKSKKELGEVTEAFQLFEKLSQQKPVNGEALLGMADILLNIYGDPLKAIQTIQPLFDINDFAEDARLTELMASLYDRDESAESLTDRIKLFSKTSMQLNRDENSFQFKENTLKKSLKPRVGIISPMFQVSPVYFLTVDFFKKIASQCDLIFFNRGTKSDWATDAFKEIGSEWHEVSFFDPITLARTIHDQDIDVLYDLGGWMDPLALKALSLKPARQQFKWVGGQSVTTGLDCFDGWMGDTWHTPQQVHCNTFRRHHARSNVSRYAAIVSSAVVDHEASRARSSPRARSSSAEDIAFRMPSTMESTLSGSTSTAAPPATSSVEIPRDVTTGAPCAMASITGNPYPSKMEGNANTVQAS
jgi:predicted O-linked N-acetylglucosamine transferase (SPINDLY family)